MARNRLASGLHRKLRHFGVLNLAFATCIHLPVDNDTMPERLQFTSVAYTYRPKAADSAPTGGGWTDDGNVVRLVSNTDKAGIGTASPHSKLQVSGSAAVAYKYVDYDYIITDSDCIIAVNTSGSKKDITLPSAVGTAGRVYTIKNVDGGYWVGVRTSSSQTIDDQSSGAIHLTLWQYVTVASDGANWLVIGKN